MLNNKKKTFAILNILRYMYHFSYEKKKVLFGYSFMFFIVNIVDQMDILLGGYIFNYIQKNGINDQTIYPVLGLVLLIFVIDIVSWGFHGPARVIELKMAFYISNNFRDYLYKNTLELPLSYHNAEHSGQIISKINKGKDAITRFAENGFMLIKSVFTGVAVFIALAIFDYRYALAGLVLMIVTYLLIKVFENKINPLRDKINKSDNILSEIIYDTISNITTIKMLSLSRLVSSSLDNETAHKFQSLKKKVVLNEIKWYIPSLIGSIFIVGVLLFYVYSVYVLGAVLMVGSLYIIYGYLFRLKDVLYDFAWMVSNIQEQNRDILNSEDISKHFEEIDKEVFVQKSNINKLTVQDIHFSYNEKFSLTVNDLVLLKGKKYAFVGESGCGKTTMLKILASLVKVDNHVVDIDGVRSRIENIKDITMLIPQEPELFSNTIRENITLGVPFEEKMITDTLELVRMKETIESLPEGLESKIFEKGVNLSGGQKQRLALARGLLFAKDKEILLLDEPTSSVDQDNEMAIYSKIFENFSDKIIVSSIHKRNLLHLFDYVVMFEKGRISAILSPEEYKAK